jgi:lysophospholipase L1-like esterase
MADKKPEVYPETGWCQVLDKYFDETVTVENHAVNGRSTKSFIDQGRWDMVLENLQRGDYVFIQFGHNDQKEYDTTRYTDPYGSYSQNLLQFIEETRAREAVPILFTPIVRRKLDTNDQVIDTHGDYPDAVRNLAMKEQVQLIDLETMTKEWIESLGETASKEMFVWTGPDEKYPNGRQDNTHLSDEGARKVAEMVVRKLKNTNADLAKRIN